MNRSSRKANSPTRRNNPPTSSSPRAAPTREVERGMSEGHV